MKIALDIDGTINASRESIEFFRILTHLLHPDPEHYIIILTNRKPNTEQDIADELGEYNIQYNEIVITSNKQDYIKQNNVSVVFENEDEYFQGLGPDVLVLKVRERGNYNYMSGRWYGDHNTVEMVDE